MVIFKDEIYQFSAIVTIQGASITNSRARLVLKFSDRTYMFEGSIDSYGEVNISVPGLAEVEDTGGIAVLEVIADNTFFEAWSSVFELRNKVTVDVASAEFKNEEPTIPTITVEIKETKSVEVEQMEEAPIDEQTEQREYDTSNLVETCSKANMKLAIDSFNRYNSLSVEGRSVLDSILENYKPGYYIERWGTSVFRDTEDIIAKVAMYDLQQNYRMGV